MEIRRRTILWLPSSVLLVSAGCKERDPDKGNLFYGSAWVDVTKENIDAYDF